MSNNNNAVLNQNRIKDYSTVFSLDGGISPVSIFGKPIETDATARDYLRLDAKYRSSTALGFNGKPELGVVRHYVKLSQKNYCVDTGFYPLGSCTMKYNPKLNERISNFQKFNIHPSRLCCNNELLKILYELQEYLKILTGMDSFTLQPSAGANGEFAGLRIIKEFFNFRKENRRKIIVPDSSHGTNPASAALLGYEIVVLKSADNGLVDLTALREKMDNDTAALMLTNPNTLGLFEKDITLISEIVHTKGGLLYYDGANMNAILGRYRPADMGFDVMHLNLHKSFATPHGCGGPGAGPVGVIGKLTEFLPTPVIDYDSETDRYFLNYSYPCSIGKIHSYFGNISVLIKAYIYIRQLGFDGLKQVSDIAVLNANYLRAALKKYYCSPFDSLCMHEFVLNNDYQKSAGVKTLDIAKRLIDYGYHPPTIYFPLITHEAIMIEPTETESKESLDAFIDAMKSIAGEADSAPELLKSAPVNAPVKRLDETLAARRPVLKEPLTFN